MSARNDGRPVEGGELQQAVRDLEVSVERYARLGVKYGPWKVPQTFVDAVDQLNTIAPFYGSVVRSSDGQRLTGRIEGIAVEPNGVPEKGVLRLAFRREDGSTPDRHEVTVPLSELDEIRFYQRIVHPERAGP